MPVNLDLPVPMPPKFGDVAGGNYSEFEADGTLVFHGDATVWEDLRVPMTVVKLAGVKDPTFSVFQGAVRAYSFSNQAVAGNEEEVFFTAQVPHSYKEGTNLVPHLHWTPSNGNAGVVRWGFEYTWQSINGVFGATATLYADDSTESTDRKHLQAVFAAIDGSGKTISSMLDCRLFRNSSHGNDTYGSGAFALEFDFHYEEDTVGSRQAADVK